MPEALKKADQYRNEMIKKREKQNGDFYVQKSCSMDRSALNPPINYQQSYESKKVSHKRD